MAESGSDANAEVPSPPSFTSLPDVAHHIIASFLPDGYMRRGNRLRVSEVSHALFDSYGGTLTIASLRDGGTDSGLAALLRRQTRLKTIVAEGQTTFPGLVQATTQGHCRELETIKMSGEGCEVDEKCLDNLAGALEVHGALPALKTLEIDFSPTPNVVSKLARALMGGTLPLLERFDVDDYGLTNEDLNLAANMLETRAGIPDCRGFKTFELGQENWLN